MEAEHTNNTNIMKDVLQLLREIVPLLESVRHSIQESTKHIPNASEQLSKVSKATETATVEILDVLDSLSMQVSKAQDEIHSLQEKMVNSRQEVMQAVQALKMQSADTEMLQHLRIIEEHVETPKLDTFFAETVVFLNTMKEQYTSIAMALQVQDITNQQIVGVSHIIETIYQHLAAALHRFDNGVHDSPGVTLDEPKEVVVDINAQYTKSPERQLSADEIVRQWQQSQQS
mgnify:CR=1 FL=1